MRLWTVSTALLVMALILATPNSSVITIAADKDNGAKADKDDGAQGDKDDGPKGDK